MTPTRTLLVSVEWGLVSIYVASALSRLLSGKIHKKYGEAAKWMLLELESMKSYFKGKENMQVRIVRNHSNTDFEGGNRHYF